MVRVPTVVLDDGETLIDSDAILDWFDEQSGPDKRLIPEKGEARRNVLQLVSWATAAGDKTVIAFYERTRRPEEMVYLPSVEGAEGQLLEAFGVLGQTAVLPHLSKSMRLACHILLSRGTGLPKRTSRLSSFFSSPESYYPICSATGPSRRWMSY